MPEWPFWGVTASLSAWIYAKGLWTWRSNATCQKKMKQNCSLRRFIASGRTFWIWSTNILLKKLCNLGWGFEWRPLIELQQNQWALDLFCHNSQLESLTMLRYHILTIGLYLGLDECVSLLKTVRDLFNILTVLSPSDNRKEWANYPPLL